MAGEVEYTGGVLAWSSGEVRFGQLIKYFSLHLPHGLFDACLVCAPGILGSHGGIRGSQYHIKNRRVEEYLLLDLD